MSEPIIVRPRLSFEEQFGQHRNWWVRDQRLAGNPLSILLFLLSHDPAKMPTQTDSQRMLGLGKDAWQSAKRTLIECGFIVEVRDRFPHNHVDRDGRHRGGQRRFRLFLQDPEPDSSVRLEDAVIELDEPYEDYLAAVEDPVCGKSAVVSKTPDQPDCGKSAVDEIPYADNPHTAENPQSFKEEKRMGLDGINKSNPSHPSSTERAREDAPATVGIDVAELDAELAEIHPSLSVAALARELRGRVPIESLDLVRACREILGANRQAGGVKYPPAYCAKSIVQAPERWQAALEPYLAPRPRQGGEETRSTADDCQVGNHWWGPESWGEIARSHCVNCGVPRRTVDAVYSELETELSFGGGR
ncbi:hypothetical protein [Leucobacter sp. GX0328]